MLYQNQNYKSYFLVLILGGSTGNLFDRLYYSAVPDFIDFHINNFHWFIFNVADIFISNIKLFFIKFYFIQINNCSFYHSFNIN